MNISELFDGYRIGNEEDMIWKKGQAVPNPSRKRDPALDFIECHHGRIGVWGDGVFYADLSSVPHKRRALAALGTVVQDGDDGLTVTFGLEQLAAACRVMGARRQYRKQAA